MALTGKFSFRKSFWGRIVLQVEEEVRPFWRRSPSGPLKRRWRDATLMDLASPEMRPLIDLRFKPQYRYASQPAPEAAAPPAEPRLEIVSPSPVQKADGELRKTAH